MGVSQKCIFGDLTQSENWPLSSSWKYSCCINSNSDYCFLLLLLVRSGPSGNHFLWGRGPSSCGSVNVSQTEMIMWYCCQTKWTVIIGSFLETRS